MECSFRAAFAALLLSSCLVAPTAARALSLQDLNGGTSFVSGDGNLMFSFEPGSVVVAGALSTDLTAYTVQVLADGFRVSGPLGIADGGLGLLLLEYDVGAVTGSLVTATLASLPSATGAGALSFLGQTASGLGSLVNAATGGGVHVPIDTLTAPGTPTSQVVTGLQLLTLAPGQLAAIAFFDQTYGISVPEPSTGLLLMAGLLGLIVVGNRRTERTG